MRVLVTGSTGFVGGAIACHLARSGHEVVGLSRGISDSLPEDVRQVQADIADLSFVERAARDVPRCDAIVHAAASRNTSLDATEVSLTNCLGTQQVLTLARKWSVERFVYISGVTVIGLPIQHPITEEHPAAPLTAYLASKLYGEHLTQIAHRAGLPRTVLRVTAPIGPGMPRNRILTIFISRALANEPIQLNGKGTRRQNYVDVRDVAAAVEQCLQRRADGLFNIGGPETISNRELAGLCIEVLGSSSPITFSGKPDPENDVVWDVSTEKAQRAIGYKPKYSTAASIRHLVREFG